MRKKRDCLNESIYDYENIKLLIAVYVGIAVFLVYFGTLLVNLSLYDFYSYSRGVCFENYCFDVYVECKYGSMNVTKITDVIYMGDDWVDRRTDEERKINCIKL